MGHLPLAMFIAFSAAALSLTGCRGHVAAPYPTWATPSAPYAPQATSGNAFDGYALAALSVEATGGKQLTRVSFYPDQRKAAIAVCDPAIKQIETASKLPCDFRFVARPPFTPAPYQQGWRLIGRALEWKIEASAQAADFDAAINLGILATRFGLDLTGGGATDASLGYVIADDARRALAPWLPKMGAAQLEKLAKGVEEALARKPGLAKTLNHEADNIRMSVQALQDAFQKDDFKQMEENLGPEAREAVEYLQGLRSNDTKRTAYFAGFAKEAEGEIRWLLACAAQPTAKREREPKFPPDLERPWKRFAHHLFLTGRPIIQMDDRTLARTRLLVLNAELIFAAKTAKRYPTDLSGFPADIKTDPFTGEPFLYRQNGAQYEIYSVGENLTDDAGDTDDTFTTPDLTLERPPQG